MILFSKYLPSKKKIWRKFCLDIWNRFYETAFMLSLNKKLRGDEGYGGKSNSVPQTILELHNSSGYHMVDLLGFSGFFSIRLDHVWIKWIGAFVFFHFFLVYVWRKSIVKIKTYFSFETLVFYFDLKVDKFCQEKIRIQLEMSRRKVFRKEYKPCLTAYISHSIVDTDVTHWQNLDSSLQFVLLNFGMDIFFSLETIRF